MGGVQVNERKGCSLKPQEVNDEVWYYESPGSISVYVDAQLLRAAVNEGHGIKFRIMKRKLKESIKRMDYKP
jgi:hypothetical protein